MAVVGRFEPFCFRQHSGRFYVWSRSAINPTIVRSHRTQKKTVRLRTSAPARGA
jgi:hypothetical protein